MKKQLVSGIVLLVFGLVYAAVESYKPFGSMDSLSDILLSLVSLAVGLALVSFHFVKDTFVKLPEKPRPVDVAAVKVINLFDGLRGLLIGLIIIPASFFLLVLIVDRGESLYCHNNPDEPFCGTAEAVVSVTSTTASITCNSVYKQSSYAKTNIFDSYGELLAYKQLVTEAEVIYSPDIYCWIDGQYGRIG